ncbi:MAG TPA: DNA cytosine methyltransferase, partial [Phormidium sp.]
VRKLTIAECYRIMGFPETFKIHPSLGESYKQIGNSVCVPMGEAVAKAILNQNLLSNEPYQPQIKTPEYKQLVLFN